MPRTENGTALIKTDNGHMVVTLDILAKLSGVGANRVARVLAALALVSNESGVGVTHLANLDHAPLAAPDQERAQATEDYYAELKAGGADVDKIKHL